MVDACRESGVLLMEAFMYRQHPSWVAARELVASGRIGKLQAVDSWFSYFNDDPRNIRNMLETGGGALYDIGCYSVNLSRMLFGAEPIGVKAAITRDPGAGVDVMTSAHPRVRGRGRHLHLLHARGVGPARRHLRDHGSDLDRDPVQHPARPADPGLPDRRRRPAGRAGDRDAHLRVADPYACEADRFAAAVLDGAPLPVEPEDAVANLRSSSRSSPPAARAMDRRRLVAARAGRRAGGRRGHGPGRRGVRSACPRAVRRGRPAVRGGDGERRSRAHLRRRRSRSTSAAGWRSSTATTTAGPTSTSPAAATRRPCTATRARPAARCAFTAVASAATDLTDVTGAYPIDIDGDGIVDLAVLRIGRERRCSAGSATAGSSAANERWGFDGGAGTRRRRSARRGRARRRCPTLAFGNYVETQPDG